MLFFFPFRTVGLSLRDLGGFIESCRDGLFVLFMSSLLFFFLWLDALTNVLFDPFMAPLVFGFFECPINVPFPGAFLDGPFGPFMAPLVFEYVPFLSPLIYEDFMGQMRQLWGN